MILYPLYIDKNRHKNYQNSKVFNMHMQIIKTKIKK